MPDEHTDSCPSRASIAGHPIHPMLVPFPIAFLIGSLATDLAFWGTDDPFWAQASMWLVLAGLAMGLLAAVSGAIDFVAIARVREHIGGWVHMMGNVIVLLLALVSLLLRWDHPVAGVLPWGLAASVIITAILGVTGWFGGELAYRHRVGVMAQQSPDDRHPRPM